MIIRRPTRAALAREHRAQSHLRRRFEVSLSGAVLNELKRVGNMAADNVAAGAGLPGIDLALIEHHSKLSQVFERQYLGAMQVYVDRVMSSAKHFRLIEVKDTQSELLRRIMVYIQSVGANRVVRVSRRTRDQLRGVLLNGVEEGLSQDVIARTIRQVVDAPIGKVRSQIIARTEVHNATQQAQADALDLVSEDLGLQDEIKREWVATQDERTRDAHVDADGQIVGLDETFTVDEVPMRFPGDPTAPPHLTINCRCVAAAVINS